MKKLILITTPLLLAACHSEMPPLTTQVPAQSDHANLPAETARRGQYLALPGQGAIDTDAAFDQQVAAYANQGAQQVTQAVQTVTEPVQGAVQSVASAPQDVMNQASTALPSVESAIGATVAPTSGASIPEPVPGVITGMVTSSPQAAQVNPAAVGAQAVDAMSNSAAAMAGVAMGGMQPAVVQTPVGGLVDYTLRITNATPGRVFIEAQDAAGEIYPCGFMTGSQSISSEKKQVAPIKGPITVVVRDPDKPDAPELRRYKVTPPADYAGKMVEITIISGGMYQVSVDGQVRYITPTPVGKPDLGTTPANPAPAPEAPAPAPEPAAPAPEANPAGI